MGNVRYAVLENDKALTTTSTSGTITTDLPERGILSNLTLLWQRGHTYVDNSMLPFYYAITKMEVLVNGSTVVKSLTGAQVRALMQYNGGPFGATGDYLQSGTANRYYNDLTLYFGRSAKDMKYGLDLAQYANPQLKFTYDEATTSHDGVTWDVDSTPNAVYNIMAKIIDGTPSGFANKYVQSREINTWTFAASAETTTEIPRGYPLRSLMLRGTYKAKAYYDFFEKVKLDFDNGKWVPIDMDYENFVRLHLDAHPELVTVPRYSYDAHGDDVNSELYYVCGSGYGGSRSNAVHRKNPIIYWPINVIDVNQGGGANQTAGGAMTWVCHGWGPMQTFHIPMSNLTDGVRETVDTASYGRIDLKTTSGSSASTSATGHIVAEYDIPNGQ